MFAKRLKELRLKLPNTDNRQEDIAKLLGIARTTYAMYEQGQREPDNATLQKIADFFEVSIDYLLGRSDNPKILSSIDKTEAEQLKAFLSDQQMLVAFHDYENWSEADKQELLNYLKVKKMSREANKSSD